MDWNTIGAAIAGATICVNLLGLFGWLIVAPFLHA